MAQSLCKLIDFNLACKYPRVIQAYDLFKLNNKIKSIDTHKIQGMATIKCRHVKFIKFRRATLTFNLFYESTLFLRNDAVDVIVVNVILFVLLVRRHRRWSFGLFIYVSVHILPSHFLLSIFRRICGAIIFKYGHKSENCFYHKIATLIIWSHIRCHVWIYC